MIGDSGPPAALPKRRWLGVVLLVFVGFVCFMVGLVVGKLDAAMFAAEVRDTAELERNSLDQDREKANRAAGDDLRARLHAATLRVATLEETLRARKEGTAPLEPSPTPPSSDPPREEAPPAVAEVPAAAASTPDVTLGPGFSSEPVKIVENPRALGPTAVTDGGQVKKVLDSLNVLLAGVGIQDSWRVASAEAVDGDRLVGAVLEVRSRIGGDLVKTLKAGEARFILLTATRCLNMSLRDGEVTYPGGRQVPFLDGRYGLLFDVDPAPFRNSGHPVILVK